MARPATMFTYRAWKYFIAQRDVSSALVRSALRLLRVLLKFNQDESEMAPDAADVAITGFGRPEDFEEGAEAGLFRHLAKPVDPSVLEGVLTDAFRFGRARRVHSCSEWRSHKLTGPRAICSSAIRPVDAMMDPVPPVAVEFERQSQTDRAGADFLNTR